MVPALIPLLLSFLHLFFLPLTTPLPSPNPAPLNLPPTNNIFRPGAGRGTGFGNINNNNDVHLPSWACVACSIECTAVVAGCSVACFLPDPAQPAVCTMCIAISGASSHCAECVPGCFGRGLVTPDCRGPAFQRCTGRRGSPGICTVKGFARSVDWAGGQCSGTKPDCDVSVKPVLGCR